MRPTLGVLPWAPEDGRGKGRPQPAQRPGWGGEEPNCSLATQGRARFWDGQDGGGRACPGVTGGKGAEITSAPLWIVGGVGGLVKKYVCIHTHTHTHR